MIVVNVTLRYHSIFVFNLSLFVPYPLERHLQLPLCPLVKLLLVMFFA